ncbi:MAG: DUF2752 domain-containing protein [Bacteroidota bacterium]
MILYKRKSSSEQNLKVRLRNEPYLIINIFFAGVILLIIAYSGFFSPEKDNYPVTCLHEKLTGEQCFSCGLSHSFSLIVRGRIDEAYRWNLYGMRVFLFFASQLILRLTFSILYLRYADTRKQLIITDCIGSGLIFLISFWPFIANIAGVIF